MTQTKWVEEQLAPGVAAIKGRLDPLPVGPYIYVCQFDEYKFLKNFMTMTHEYSHEFTWKIGTVVYVAGLDGMPYMVAQYYDTSD